ncbi:response regulator transcription factor [Noviherbaspirillum sp. 17J57-3]|uniref:Response regulator transcription factor n=2 Tax=Noviherbaspirillum galbum TaxID=2709383 RepID=A0A6B3SJR3_9BURK|nr:response regulator transcription factor [Noviherbaspirillum galbum]
MLVDDHPMMVWGLSKLIQGEYPRMEVVGVATRSEEALARVASLAPDVIALDLDLGGQNTIDILPELLEARPASVLILTASRDQALLDLAVVRGARGVISKDAPADQILKAIAKLNDGELWLDRETMSRVLGGLVRPAGDKAADPERMKQEALTDKERKIIHTLVENGGLPHKALAQRLFISEHTLRNHLTSIYQKLEVGNRLELYVYAMRHRLGSSAKGGPDEPARQAAAELVLPADSREATAARGRIRRKIAAVVPAGHQLFRNL